MKPLIGFFQEISEISKELNQKNCQTKINEALKNYQEGKFIVAAVGEFKRGKSSLLNALLSKKIFPVGVLPLTSVITVAQYGEKEEYLVYFEDGSSKNITLLEIENFVTENGNSGNKLNVKVALAKAPLNLLSNGIKLVDTPGIGSIVEKNSEVTKEFVPEIDVALVVSGFDPPITADELKLIKEVEKEASNIIVVLNKSDIVDEKTKKEIEEFTRKALVANGIKNYQLFSVSANPKNNIEVDTKIEELKEFLVDLAKSSSKTIVEESAKRTLSKLCAELLQFIDVEIFSLKEPSISLEKKLSDFQEKISDLEIWILAAKAKSLSSFKIDPRSFEEIKIDLENKAAEEAKAIKISNSPKTKIRKEVKEKVRKIAQEYCEKFSESAFKLIEEIEQKREIVLRKEFEEIGKRIKKAGAETFGITFSNFEMEVFVKEKKRNIFEFVETKGALDFSDLLSPVFDFIFPRSVVFENAIEEGRKLLKEWLRENFGRITESFVEELDQMTTNQASFFETKLKETAKDIHLAIEEGKKKKEKDEASVSDEIKRLEKIKQKLISILSATNGNGLLGG